MQNFYTAKYRVFSQTVQGLYSGDFKVTDSCPFSFNYKLDSYLLVRCLVKGMKLGFAE